VRFDCVQLPRCTADSQRFTQAGKAGRSRRPRQGCVSVACSTRIRHSAMERAAVGAAATERWSVRGPGVETTPRAAEASQQRPAGWRQLQTPNRVSGECLTARADATPRSSSVISVPLCLPNASERRGGMGFETQRHRGAQRKGAVMRGKAGDGIRFAVGWDPVLVDAANYRSSHRPR
jgi:hypothetical protein